MSIEVEIALKGVQGPPGPAGDVTPAAQAARDSAISASQAASSFATSAGQSAEAAASNAGMAAGHSGDAEAASQQAQQSAMLAEMMANETGVDAASSALSAAQAEQSALNSSGAVAQGYGLQSPVPYVAGLNINSTTFSVSYEGETYSAASVGLPFTTGEVFDPLRWVRVVGVDRNVFKDQAGKTLDAFRSTNLAEAHRSLPMCVALTRTSNVDMSNNNPAVPVAWGTRLVDAGVNWSSTEPTRITIPAGTGGVWRFRASLEFPANATGVREVLIRRGGTTIMARTTVPANSSSRTLVVHVDTGPIAAVGGNYFEVLFYQDSGVTLQGPAAQAKFQAERIGDFRGRWEGVTFSADYGYRADWSKYASTGGTVIEPSGLLVAADPVNPSLVAGRIRGTRFNNSVLYPRVQAQTSSFIALNANIYVGLSVFIPQETHDRLLAAGHGINIHEIYGPPFGTRSPNLLQYNPIFGLNLNAYIGGQSVRTWSLPPSECVGKWIDIVHRVNMSTDPAVGYHELFVNKGDGNGRVQQTLSDGTQSGLRFMLATVIAGVNNGGNNFSSLKVSWDGTSDLQEATIFVGEHRVGTDLFVTTDRSDYNAAL